MTLINLETSLANSKNGDPCLWTLCKKSGNAILFDLGKLDALSNRALLKAEIACVSHTHIDHFIGFDRLLRVHIPHFRTIRIAGPVNIQINVQAKLRGYLWNLLEEDQIKAEVYEVTEAGVKRFALNSSNNYQLVELPDLGEEAAETGHFVYRMTGGGVLSASILDHGTPSIAYRLDTPGWTKVDSDKIVAMELSPGAWISEAQRALKASAPEQLIDVAGRQMSAKTIAAEFFTAIAGESLGYATDFVFSAKNIKRFVPFFHQVDSLWLDSSFADADSERATKTLHLSTKQSALLAALAEAGDFNPFHFSAIYGESFSGPEKEAKRFFEQYKGMTKDELSRQMPSAGPVGSVDL